MTVLKKALIAAAGAVASFYATKYAQKILEERSLDDRMEDVKNKVFDIRTGVATKVVNAKSRVDTRIDELSKKIDALIERIVAEKVEQKPPTDDAPKG